MERPFRGFVDFVHELGRASNRMYDVYHNPHPTPQGEERTQAWVPTADAFVRGGDLIIRVELPGIRRGDINVTLSGGVLTLSGVRDNDFETKDSGFYLRERLYGAFRRSMSLPENVGEQDLEANFEDGVLEIVARGGGEDVPEPNRIRIGGPSS